MVKKCLLVQTLLQLCLMAPVLLHGQLVEDARCVLP